MAEPEVTREEAERLSLACNYEPAVSLARTVVALYDLLDEKSEEVDDKSRVGHAVADAWEQQFRTALECIDRLRCGYQYNSDTYTGKPTWWHPERGHASMTEVQRKIMEGK